MLTRTTDPDTTSQQGAAERLDAVVDRHGQLDGLIVAIEAPQFASVLRSADSDVRAAVGSYFLPMNPLVGMLWAAIELEDPIRAAEVDVANVNVVADPDSTDEGQTAEEGLERQREFGTFATFLLSTAQASHSSGATVDMSGGRR